MFHIRVGKLASIPICAKAKLGKKKKLKAVIKTESIQIKQRLARVTICIIGKSSRKFYSHYKKSHACQ